MDIKTAKKIVCEAGLNLSQKGLVPRTWGNISQRIDENRFVITPSGRNYNDITPDDIVLMDIHDLSYEGSVKPSSEKRLHAEVLRNRKNVNAVIHTHQTHASTVAAAKCVIPVTDREVQNKIGTSINCTPNAIPGSKKLARLIAMALDNNNAALIANHGTFCAGENMDDAFEVAILLEKICLKFIEDSFLDHTGRHAPFDIKEMHEYYLTHYSKR